MEPNKPYGRQKKRERERENKCVQDEKALMQTKKAQLTASALFEDET